MAKISLREAMTDFITVVFDKMYHDDSKRRYTSEEIMNIFYESMFKIALEYVDRADDVVTREMSLEVDRLNNIVDGLRDENRRLRDKEEPCK
jgi:hypothetical protein